MQPLLSSTKSRKTIRHKTEPLLRKTVPFTLGLTRCRHSLSPCPRTLSQTPCSLGKNPPGKLNPETLHAQTLRATRTQNANMPTMFKHNTASHATSWCPLGATSQGTAAFIIDPSRASEASHNEPFNLGVLKLLRRNLKGVYSKLFTDSRARCSSARCACVALLGLLVSGFCEALLALGFASGFSGLLFAWAAAGGFC